MDCQAPWRRSPQSNWKAKREPARSWPIASRSNSRCEATNPSLRRTTRSVNAFSKMPHVRPSRSKNTDQRVDGGEAAVETLGGVIERGLSGHSQEATNWFDRIWNQQRLAAVFLSEQCLDRFSLSEPPAE